MAKCTDPKEGSLLHAYEIGALSEPDMRRFEIHVLGCDHCFARVYEFEREADLLLRDMDVKEAVTNADRAHARRASVWGRLAAYLWPRAPLLFKPAVAYLIIALMAVPAYRGVVRHDDREGNQLPSQYAILDDSVSDGADTAGSGMTFGDRIDYLAEKLAAVSLLDNAKNGVNELAGKLAATSLSGGLQDKIEALGGGSVQSITLTGLRDSNSPRLQRQEGQWAEIRFSFGEATQNKSYYVGIFLEGSEETAFEDSTFSEFDELGMGRLYLPISLFEPGRYRLIIIDTEAEPPLDRQVYRFAIE